MCLFGIGNWCTFGYPKRDTRNFKPLALKLKPQSPKALDMQPGEGLLGFSGTASASARELNSVRIGFRASGERNPKTI